MRQSDNVLISPSVKLEYQPDFGAETVCKSLLSREWISALIRPGSLATRLRVDAVTSELCMVEQKTLGEVSQEGFSKGLDFSIQLGNLYNVFNGLKDLAAGQYLLQHDEKSGPFCRLLKAKEGGGASAGTQYDLHTAYNVRAEDTAPLPANPWLPIDCKVKDLLLNVDFLQCLG